MVPVFICVALLSASCFGTQTAVKKPVPRKIVPKTALPKIDLPKPKLKPIEVVPIKIKPVEIPGQLMLSPSAETGTQLYASWPLIISVNLWRTAATPDDKGNAPTLEPITIKAKEGSWREALVIEVKSASGAVVKLPLHPVKQSDSSVTIGADDSASAQWWLEPDETQDLAVGTYKIVVYFDFKLVDGLPDKVGRDVFHLRIANEPSPLDKETEFEKQLQMAMLSMFKGDSKTANDLVDKLLAADSENIGGHRFKARLLLAEGKKNEAVSSLDNALTAYHKKYPDACPPAGLFEERADILKDIKLETAPADANAPAE